MSNSRQLYERTRKERATWTAYPGVAQIGHRWRADCPSCKAFEAAYLDLQAVARHPYSRTAARCYSCGWQGTRKAFLNGRRAIKTHMIPGAVHHPSE